MYRQGERSQDQLAKAAAGIILLHCHTRTVPVRGISVFHAFERTFSTDTNSMLPSKTFWSGPDLEITKYSLIFPGSILRHSGTYISYSHSQSVLKLICCPIIATSSQVQGHRKMLVNPSIPLSIAGARLPCTSGRQALASLL